MSLLRKTDGGVCGAQIFGNEPSVMAEAAAFALELSGADFIDINMGCPMPKIVNNGDGSALLAYPERAARIVEVVVTAVSVPVTVKMRKGWGQGQLQRGGAGEARGSWPGVGRGRPWADKDDALFRRGRLGRHPGREGVRVDPGDRKRRHFLGGRRSEVPKADGRGRVHARARDVRRSMAVCTVWKRRCAARRSARLPFRSAWMWRCGNLTRGGGQGRALSRDSRGAEAFRVVSARRAVQRIL